MEIKKNIDLDLERRNFEASGICTKSMFENVMWDQWLFKYVPLVREKKICDNAIKINDRFLGWKAAKSQASPEGFVLVDKKHTEDWYLDDHEGMWWDQDGIDNSLCDLDPGQVQAVEHKEYLITESNTLYAAKVWDDLNDQVGYWEFFKTKDEADKAAAYCKAKFKGEPVKAQEQSHDSN